VKLLVQAKGRAKQVLRRRGRAKVRTRVSYTPDGGGQSQKSRRIRLRKEVRNERHAR
jgi:hypothetical protein